MCVCVCVCARACACVCVENMKAAWALRELFHPLHYVQCLKHGEGCDGQDKMAIGGETAVDDADPFFVARKLSDLLRGTVSRVAPCL